MGEAINELSRGIPDCGCGVAHDPRCDYHPDRIAERELAAEERRRFRCPVCRDNGYSALYCRTYHRSAAVHGGGR